MKKTADFHDGDQRFFSIFCEIICLKFDSAAISCPDGGFLLQFFLPTPILSIIPIRNDLYGIRIVLLLCIYYNFH